MKSQKNVSEAANFADAQKVFEMFRAAYEFPRPLIAQVQGGAYGGGAGLMCCSDIVVMAEDAVTAFSEVRLGIIPAAISAFVTRKIGAGRARELFLTGRKITAMKCLELGLATEVVPALQLDSAVERWVSELLAGSPSAQVLAKELLREVPFMALDNARDFAAAKLARQRVTLEGQEGLTSLLEKRKPFWAEGGE
jgi:methylglutaconyl-CoA hydratase